jgi:hypothetical protein
MAHHSIQKGQVTLSDVNKVLLVLEHIDISPGGLIINIFDKFNPLVCAMDKQAIDVHENKDWGKLGRDVVLEGIQELFVLVIQELQKWEQKDLELVRVWKALGDLTKLGVCLEEVVSDEFDEELVYWGANLKVDHGIMPFGEVYLYPFFFFQLQQITHDAWILEFLELSLQILGERHFFNLSALWQVLDDNSLKLSRCRGLDFFQLDDWLARKYNDFSGVHFG